MSESGIMQQVMHIEKSNKAEASHFALCNGGHIRYLIALDGESKKRLSKNISAYSGKLGLLMKLMRFIPFSALKTAGMGHFVRVELALSVQTTIDKLTADAWNMIVGTYDEKQKVVLQCYRHGEALSDFVKVGNSATDKEMKAEIDFLKEPHLYRCFDVPELLESSYTDKQTPFNIQVTKEFVGKKVEPVINDDIIRIYQEISANKKIIDGVEYEFSHGDFAPWNIKSNAEGYVVFDWEHCGYRIKGFDLMHYGVVSRVMLEGMELSEAFDESMELIHQFLSEYKLDKELFIREYQKLRLG